MVFLSYHATLHNIDHVPFDKISMTRARSIGEIADGISTYVRTQITDLSMMLGLLEGIDCQNKEERG
jgi:hypothetical protein